MDLARIRAHLIAYGHADGVHDMHGLRDGFLVAGGLRQAYLYQKDTLEALIGVPSAGHRHRRPGQTLLPLQMAHCLQLPREGRLVGHDAKASFALVVVVVVDNRAPLQKLDHQALPQCISQGPMPIQKSIVLWSDKVDTPESCLQISDRGKALQGPLADECGVDVVERLIPIWILAAQQTLLVAREPCIVQPGLDERVIELFSPQGDERDIPMTARSSQTLVSHGPRCQRELVAQRTQVLRTCGDAVVVLHGEVRAALGDANE
mmetsp:Transcript_18385/g.59695  ORF Transcript_18385/g.59695 Transcript_18385/m.59695 type:complete len:263 (-) Transcript_18385:112-900(-)